MVALVSRHQQITPILDRVEGPHGGDQIGRADPDPRGAGGVDIQDEERVRVAVVCAERGDAPAAGLAERAARVVDHHEVVRGGEIVRELPRDPGGVGLGVHHTGSDGKVVGAEYLRELTKLETVVALPFPVDVTTAIARESTCPTTLDVTCGSFP